MARTILENPHAYDNTQTRKLTFYAYGVKCSNGMQIMNEWMDIVFQSYL